MVPHANDGHVDLSGPVPRRPSKKSGRKKKREPASRRGAKPRVVLDGSQQLGTPGPQNLIVDIATFTHSKPAGEKWVPHLNGPNQGGFATSAITQEMLKQMKGRLAGQDYAMTLHPIPGDISQTLCLILDGHGEFGELFAVYGGEALAAKYEEKWGELRQLCITGDFAPTEGLTSSDLHSTRSMHCSAPHLVPSEAVQQRRLWPSSMVNGWSQRMWVTALRS